MYPSIGYYRRSYKYIITDEDKGQNREAIHDPDLTYHIGLGTGSVCRGPKTLSTTEAINGVGQIKIGYIDSNRIMQEYEEVRDAQAKLEKETRRLQVEYNTYVERLDSLNREFERLRSKLSNEKIREKEQELQSLYQTTQAFQQAKFSPEGELYRYQAQLMAPVLDKVDAAVKRIGAVI